MRRILLGSLFAALLLIGAGGLFGASPAFAHDAPFAAQGQSGADASTRDEAAQLTDELKSAAIRAPKGPAIQAAVASKAERRRDLINRLATTNPAGRENRPMISRIGAITSPTYTAKRINEGRTAPANNPVINSTPLFI